MPAHKNSIPYSLAHNVLAEKMNPNAREALALGKDSRGYREKEIYEAFGNIIDDIAPVLLEAGPVESVYYGVEGEDPQDIYYPRKFLIAFTKRTGKYTNGVVKIAGSRHAKEQLAREYRNIAGNPIGLRLPEIMIPQKDTQGGRALVEYHCLSRDDFEHFPHTEAAVAGIDPEYARYIAESHTLKVWRGIDAGVAIPDLPEAAPRSRSGQAFFSVLEREIRDVLRPHNVAWLGQRVDEARELLEPLIVEGEGHATYCLDDMRQDNFFFEKGILSGGLGDPVVYIDQEFGGLTCNRVLGLLTDAGALIGRQVSLRDRMPGGKEPSAFRRAYMKTLLEINPFEDAQKTRDFVRAALIVGTIFELRTQISIHGDFENSWLGRANLENLSFDLDWLEDIA